jgi:hypothetical protein
MDYPKVVPLAFPEDREPITGEPEPTGTRHQPFHGDIDWVGHANQGGGYVPEDYTWPTNPKQRQEEESSG